MVWILRDPALGNDRRDDPDSMASIRHFCARHSHQHLVSSMNILVLLYRI